MRFFDSGFFHESVSPQPQSILFQIFSVLGDIRKSRCTTGINYTGGKFAPGGVNDTGGKIAASINNTSGKFAAGVNETGGKFCTSFTSVVDTGGKFSTGGKQWEQYQAADALN
jgi:hypothetical protein